MLTIKLKRIGRKHQPSFRVIVTPRGQGGPKGKPVEELGWMNPLLKKFSLNKERIQYWMQQGAQPSSTVYNMLVKSGIVQGSKKAKHKAAAAHETQAPAAGQAEQKAE